MQTDIEVLSAMLIRADIGFRVDSGDSAGGWAKRVVLEGDRCFVFRQDGSLAGMRSVDNCHDFDSGPY